PITGVIRMRVNNAVSRTLVVMAVTEKLPIFNFDDLGWARCPVIGITAIPCRESCQQGSVWEALKLLHIEVFKVQKNNVSVQTDIRILATHHCGPSRTFLHRVG